MRLFVHKCRHLKTRDYYFIVLFYLFNFTHLSARYNIGKNVKQSHYRPGVTQRVPGS